MDNRLSIYIYVGNYAVSKKSIALESSCVMRVEKRKKISRKFQLKVWYLAAVGNIEAIVIVLWEPDVAGLPLLGRYLEYEFHVVAAAEAANISTVDIIAAKGVDSACTALIFELDLSVAPGGCVITVQLQSEITSTCGT